MPGHSLWWKICSILLCQCYLFAVLLWILLGKHTLSCWARVPQTTGKGGRWSAPPCPVPLELNPRPHPATSTGVDKIKWKESAASGLSVLEICAFVLDFNEDMGLFITIIIIIYSHITELSVQYNTNRQSVTVLILHFDSHKHLLGTLISYTRLVTSDIM